MGYSRAAFRYLASGATEETVLLGARGKLYKMQHPPPLNTNRGNYGDAEARAENPHLAEHVQTSLSAKKTTLRVGGPC